MLKGHCVEQQITIEFDIPAILRDGTVLRATIYRPAGEGRWLVLLMRTISGKDLPRLDGLFDLDSARVARLGENDPCDGIGAVDTVDLETIP
jgi:uncharacterized protein